jgi:hypothetical protein
MSTVLAILPLLLTVAAYAAFAKLASRIYRRSQLPWKHAFAFSALGVVLGALGSFVHLSVGALLPAVLAAVLGIGMQVALGGWFLGPRALALSGAPVSFKGGAAIAAIAAAFGLVFGVLGAVILPALMPHGQA